MATKAKTLGQPIAKSSGPCSVDLPVPDDCCVSPCEPPWIPEKQCIVRYESKFFQVPIAVDERKFEGVAATFAAARSHRVSHQL